jgi:uncharacterized protein YchJ
MAKLRGPLLSTGAHGSIAKRLTYSRRSSGNQVRFQKANHDADSTSQQTERSLFLEARSKWNSLSDEEKELWNEYNKS